MLKKNLVRIVLGAALFTLQNAGAAGIGGAGNTGDSAIQLEFVKATGVQILKSVAPKDFPEVSALTAASDLYAACRETMLVGALKSKFLLVDNIPDGGEYHALAKRTSAATIEISRREMQRLMKNGTYSATLLIGLFLHEVGHDCTYNGKAVDDSFDQLLNQLGGALISAYNVQSLTSYIDVDFIARLKEKKPSVTVFQDLSHSVRKRVARKFMDYFGDWLYLQNQSSFTGRPAPASDFYANSLTSLFPGWGTLPMDLVTTPTAIRLAAGSILKASYETTSLSYFNGVKNAPLPTKMGCSWIEDGGDHLPGARCTLQISWEPVMNRLFNSTSMLIAFDVDMASNIKFNEVRMMQ